MNGKTMMFLLVAILLLPCGSVFAESVSGNPTLLLPNSATNTPYTFASARPVENGYSLNAMYHDEDGIETWYRSGAILSNAPGSLSWGVVPDSHSNVYASPASFEAKAYHHAQTDGSRNNYSYGSSQVWNWYVLGGNPGQVTLAVDLLLQGVVYANYSDDGNAGTIFGTSLGFLSSPDDLTQDYVTSVTGAVNWTGFSTQNTVDEDVVWDIGDTSHELNYIVRSQPFTVTVGVPFRLSLLTSAQGFAGPGGWGEAWSDFYDPSLVTSDDFPDIPDLTPDGFAVVLEGGVYSDLGDQGFSVSTVPEPSSLLLVGIGAISLFGYTWRRKRAGTRRPD